jgi:hypothetical protein
MKDHKPFNWSKDFVEHLRTVHFALAAVSLALIIAISAQDRRLPIALRQIEQIARFEKQWPGVRAKIYRHISNADEYEYVDVSVRSDLIKPNQLYLQNKITSQDLTDWTQWRTQGHSWPSDLTTLADFKSVWDDFAKGADVSTPVQPNDHSRCTVHISSASPTVEGQLLRFFSIDSTNCETNTVNAKIGGAGTEVKSSFSLSYLFPLAPTATLTITSYLPQVGYELRRLPKQATVKLESDITLEMRKVHLTESIFREIFFSDWGTGTFAQAFPELNAEASDFATVDLADTIARVQSQATTASNSISLLGLTIPLIQLTRWGPLVLLAVQLYFWLHLHELVRKIEPDADGWDVAWIGIYRTMPAFVVALFSACLLPAIAAICLGVTFVTSHYYGRGFAIAGCLLTIIAGVLFSILTAARLFSLRNMVEAENRDVPPSKADELENV